MNLWLRLLKRIGWGRAPLTPPPTPPATTAHPGAAAGVSLSGRPSYAIVWGGNALLPRQENFALLATFRGNIPVIKRGIEILARFVGTPTLVVPDDEKASERLNEWACGIEYGDGVGYGLGVWLRDMIDNSLTYGFGLGEMEISPTRDGLSRLWMYLSPSIAFRTDQHGALSIVQMIRGGWQPLNPDTVVRAAHDPIACNPMGESLLLALPTFCQAYLTVHHAHQSTWERSGVPIHHIHTQLPKELNDPDGKIAQSVITASQAAWNEGMRSQVVDGVVKDFFTASVGQATVTVIGAESQVLDVAESNRVLAEQFTAATGIPPFMFGFSWATTERMSSQQAKMFVETIECIRREVSGAITKIVETQQLLSGKGLYGRGVELEWEDISLVEEVETAIADYRNAQAAQLNEATGRLLWVNGVFNQEGYAEYVTGSAEVDIVLSEPAVSPGAAPAAAGPQDGPQDSGDGGGNGRGMRIWEEMRSEYPHLWKRAPACNGKH